MAGKNGSLLGKRKAAAVDEEEDVDYSSWTVALLKNELSARGLSTSGRKALLVERLEEADGEGEGQEDIGDAGEAEEEQNDYSSWTVAELKAELKVRGLAATGRKALLVERLEDADNGVEGDVEMEEEEKPKAKKEKKVTPPPKKAAKTKDRVMSREAAHSVVGLFTDVSGAPPKVKTYKFGRASDEPLFEEPISVVRHVVLQVTDIKNNHNKYYSMELHESDSCGFRVYTHYGRTDDLTTNPNAGQKETRYVSSLDEAKLLYNKIYKDKTSARKGYQPVNLSSTKIGSAYVQGKSAGYVDQATKDAAAGSGPSSPKAAKKAKTSTTLSPAVQQLVRKVYAEATQTLMSQVSVSITANGIETPLGILTIAQVEDGEYILDKIQEELNRPKPRSNILVELSGEFYTTIPHRIGRSQASIAAAVIRTEEAYKAKMELMQLMKDMLEVCEEGGSVLFDDDVESKYQALNCDIERLDPACEEYNELMDFLSISQTRGIGNYGDKKPKANGKVSYRILDIYKVKKQDAEQAFTKKIKNKHLLYHGSRMCNWMGLLSRGILMPNAVTKLGIPRTDFGWLGAGIYFGDCYKTSAQYCIPGQDGSSMAMICEVALGKMHEQAQIDGKITSPPAGHDSIHGNPSLPMSGFADHEYCVYTQAQQTPRYLINFRR